MANTIETNTVTSPRNILITGATGKQGTALIHALLESPTTATEVLEYHIFALTRNASSPSALRLQSQKHVTVVEGDLDSPSSITRIFEDVQRAGQAIWGVFAVLAYPGLGAAADGEAAQGRMLVDMACRYGVSVFVYSSGARSGPRYEAELKLSGAAKRDVESYCRQRGEGEKGLNWTILRPGFFMENFDNFIGSIAVSVLKAGLKEETEIGLIATDDIGSVAARVFENPDRYKHKTLVAIGDFQTMSQLQDSYKHATGRSIPSIPATMAWFITKINKATQDLISDIERQHYARKAGEYPELDGELRLANEAFKMRNYGEWVKDEKRDRVGSEGWNKLSVMKLLTGQL